MRGRIADCNACAARSISCRAARAKAAIMGRGTAAATAWTAAKSPSDAMGNPASITSTPSWSSCRPRRTFSCTFMLQPGDCSPSRKVVSKIVILVASIADSIVEYSDLMGLSPESKAYYFSKLLSTANVIRIAYGSCSLINRGAPCMDISQLEVFLAVAREGGFSRAADKLYRTQSAVSQAIRKLEAEIGEPLFDRSSREGLLTDAGRVLQEYAERLRNVRENASVALA